MQIIWCDKMFNNHLFPQDIIKCYDTKSDLSVGKFSPGRSHICNWDCAGISKSEKRILPHKIENKAIILVKSFIKFSKGFAN